MIGVDREKGPWMSAGMVLGGRYELRSQLGAGGFGSVWRGADTLLLREVGVKLIHLDTDVDTQARDAATLRFKREAQAVAGLNHPNVVAAYDFGIEGSFAYLVMELVNGSSLAQVLRQRRAAGQGPLDVPTVLRIASETCAGLGVAHRAGLVHRDLKPANLMITEPEGQLKIVDFGIARISDRSRITRTGSYMGTLPYIAPEQMMALPLDSRADIYSLGCLLHELLTGRSPYDAETPVQWLAAHQYTAPAPLSAHLAGAPPGLERLILDMLAKDPAARPQNVDVIRARVATIAANPNAGMAPDLGFAATAAIPGLVAPGPGTPQGPVSAPPATPMHLPVSGHTPPPPMHLPVNATPNPATPQSAPPVPPPPAGANPTRTVPYPGGPASAPPYQGPQPEVRAMSPSPEIRAMPQSPAGPPVNLPPINRGAFPPAPSQKKNKIGLLIGITAAVLVLLVGALVAIGPLHLLNNKKGGSGNSGVGALPTGNGSPTTGGVGGVGGAAPCGLKIAYLGTENSATKIRDVAEYNGMRLALAQYNAQHADCPVTAARFDTNPDALTAPGDTPPMKAAQQLVADTHVVGVIGPATSADALAAMPILNTAGIPEITPSATNDELTTHKYKVFHRAIGPRATLDNTVGTYVAGLSGARAFLVDDGSLYGTLMTNAVKAEAKNIVVGTRRVASEDKQTDFSSTVSRIISAKATVVVYGGYADNAGHLLNQLRAAGSTAEFVIGDLTDQPAFSTFAGSVANTASVICLCTVPSLASGSFGTAYTSMFGSKPDLYADIAFDVTNMMIAGLKSGAGTRAQLLAYISTKSYQGISNTYSFTSDGKLDPAHVIVYKYPVGGASQQQITPASSG
jgi:serine/threonine protein kinase/ABC-type branched-subunit amino acid transport system substrate-binding protein